MGEASGPNGPYPYIPAPVQRDQIAEQGGSAGGSRGGQRRHPWLGTCRAKPRSRAQCAHERRARVRCAGPGRATAFQHQSHHVQQGCRGAIICAHVCKSARGGQHEEPGVGVRVAVVAVVGEAVVVEAAIKHQAHHVQQGCRGAISCAHLCEGVREGQHEEPMCAVVGVAVV